MTLSCVKNTAFDSAFKQYSTLERNTADFAETQFLYTYIYYTVSKKCCTVNTVLCEKFCTFMGYCPKRSGPKGTLHSVILHVSNKNC